jgi:hypothetical protein
MSATDRVPHYTLCILKSSVCDFLFCRFEFECSI